MPLTIIKSDITKMQSDAIVNAANNTLQISDGVCGAVFNAAGAAELAKACGRIGRCETGSAVVTEGFALSKYIIHTVGPVWQGGTGGERNLLYACYRNSLALAKKCGCESIAFPLISSGACGYPKEKALRVAVKAIGDFLLENDMAVSLVVFDDIAFSLSGTPHMKIQNFIKSNYKASYNDKIDQSEFEALRNAATSHIQSSAAKPSALKDMLDIIRYSSRSAFARETEENFQAPQRRLENIVDELEDNFQKMLFRLIDERGLTDPTVWKRANIDRRVFAAIRRPDYKPSKNTALCLAIALELSLDVSIDLLGRAGFALSPSSVHDLIVKYFINEKIYDIFKINETLYQYGQNLLGSTSK